MRSRGARAVASRADPIASFAFFGIARLGVRGRVDDEHRLPQSKQTHRHAERAECASPRGDDAEEGERHRRLRRPGTEINGETSRALRSAEDIFPGVNPVPVPVPVPVPGDIPVPIPVPAGAFSEGAGEFWEGGERARGGGGGPRGVRDGSEFPRGGSFGGGGSRNRRRRERPRR